MYQRIITVLPLLKERMMGVEVPQQECKHGSSTFWNKEEKIKGRSFLKEHLRKGEWEGDLKMQEETAY